MNFIGHATVALWFPLASAKARADTRTAPEFVLGSMLPDFAGMAGTRLVRSDPGLHHDPLAAGIALHHRTDDAFHGAAPFVALLQQTLDELTSLGVSRGAARAVAHIGTEMLIDGELVRAPEVGEAYARALAVDRPLDAWFVDPAGGTRWAALRDRLRTYGVPHDYGDPESVLRRLQVVLRGRPRLALDAESAPLVRAHLPALQRKVVIALPLLLESVRESLGATRVGQTD